MRAGWQNDDAAAATCPKTFSELKMGHAKIFNFSPKMYKLSNSISRDSGDFPYSSHTKYVNYECLGLKEIGVIFPSLRDA
jgi:hypothetical protein